MRTRGPAHGSPPPQSILSDSRLPHPIYGEHPGRRTSYERERVSIHGHRSSSSRLLREEAPRARYRFRSPSPIHRSPSPVRGVWKEVDSEQGSDSARRDRSPTPPRLGLRARSRTRSRRPRRLGSRSRVRHNDDGFIRGALPASVTALAINRARNWLEDPGRERASSRGGRRPRNHRRRTRSSSRG